MSYRPLVPATPVPGAGVAVNPGARRLTGIERGAGVSPHHLDGDPAAASQPPGTAAASRGGWDEQAWLDYVDVPQLGPQQGPVVGFVTVEFDGTGRAHSDGLFYLDRAAAELVVADRNAFIGGETPLDRWFVAEVVLNGADTVTAGRTGSGRVTVAAAGAVA